MTGCIFFQAILVTALSALCFMRGFSAFSLILLGVTVMPIEELVWFMVVGMVFEHLEPDWSTCKDAVEKWKWSRNVPKY